MHNSSHLATWGPNTSYDGWQNSASGDNVTAMFGPPEFNHTYLIGTVNDLYGPGAVGGWLLSCVAFLISLAYPDVEDTISLEFIVAISYPLVASGHLISHWVRYAKDWRIYQEWRGFRARLQQSMTVDVLPWRELLSLGYGESAMKKYHCGIFCNSISLEVGAFPYLSFACVQVIILSLLFFTLLIPFLLLAGRVQKKRYFTIMVAAYAMSVILWIHLAMFGRDFDTEAHFNCLQFSDRAGYCNRPIINKNAYRNLTMGRFDIATVCLLMISGPVLVAQAAWTQIYFSILPLDIRSSTTTTMRQFRRHIPRFLLQHWWLYLPTIVLAVLHLTILRVLHSIAQPMMTPMASSGSLARRFPFGLRNRSNGSGASLFSYYVRDISQNTFPVTSSSIADVDQSLALVMGTIAVLANLRTLIHQRSLIGRIKRTLLY